MLLHYKDHVPNAVYGNNLCLYWEAYKTCKYKMQCYRLLKQVLHTVAIQLEKANLQFLLASPCTLASIVNSSQNLIHKKNETTFLTFIAADISFCQTYVGSYVNTSIVG
jgi:hypothetical protein